MRKLRAWGWWICQIFAHIVLRVCLVLLVMPMLLWTRGGFKRTPHTNQAAFDWYYLWTMRWPRPPRLLRPKPHSGSAKVRPYRLIPPSED